VENKRTYPRPYFDKEGHKVIETSIVKRGNSMTTTIPQAFINVPNIDREYKVAWVQLKQGFFVHFVRK
jgi:antitoxin component of MazEF toxin-antitoxin module